MESNLIPELTELAQNNICFSSTEHINGAYHVSGAEFTMGALVAQTSGVPINETIVDNDTLNGYWESENNYLAGVFTIGDVLGQENYNQVFMLGSNSQFAGRGSYFSEHGNYEVMDYATAVDSEWIDFNYRVWWGYEEQYSNVISCSSRQVYQFVQWIMQQDFYENTTIVITGDHLTMDSDYINRMHANNFDRRMYFCIINPAENCEYGDVDRVYTSLDLYPITLAAMGVSIPEKRLGLGTNLFSKQGTLAEQMGLETLDMELLKNSEFYTQNLLYID